MHYQRSLQEAPWRSHPLGHCFVPQIGKWPPGTENLIFLKPRPKGKTIFGGPVELMIFLGFYRNDWRLGSWEAGRRSSGPGG